MDSLSFLLFTRSPIAASRLIESAPPETPTTIAASATGRSRRRHSVIKLRTNLCMDQKSSLRRTMAEFWRRPKAPLLLKEGWQPQLPSCRRRGGRVFEAGVEGDDGVVNQPIGWEVLSDLRSTNIGFKDSATKLPSF